MTKKKQKQVRETRTIEEIKIYRLVLNPIIAPESESSIVALGYDKERLLDWYNSQLEEWESLGPEKYSKDGKTFTWKKSFKKGSMIEWYNKLENPLKPNKYNQGIFEEWVKEDVLTSGKFFIVE